MTQEEAKLQDKGRDLILSKIAELRKRAEKGFYSRGGEKPAESMDCFDLKTDLRSLNTTLDTYFNREKRAKEEGRESRLRYNKLHRLPRAGEMYIMYDGSSSGKAYICHDPDENNGPLGWPGDPKDVLTVYPYLEDVIVDHDVLKQHVYDNELVEYDIVNYEILLK